MFYATPEESIDHIAAQWLLNIAFMTVGEYPAGVPEMELIDPELFASEADFPEFPDVSHHAGTDTFNLAGGMIVDDFNGDLLPDVFTSSWNPRENVRYFQNRGGQRFDDVTSAAGLGHLQKGHGVSFVDFDGDGDQDVFEQLGGFYPY